MQAVVSGTGKHYGKIQYTKEEYPKEMETNQIIIYTSGLGGLFKPGIPIGKISRGQTKRVNFFSDFKQLEYVKIISYNNKNNN